MVYDVTVRNRIITLDSIRENLSGVETEIVGGNKGDIVYFSLDDEWTALMSTRELKASFVWRGKYYISKIETDGIDAVYCYAPPIFNTNSFYLGIYVGEDINDPDYMSTTKVEIPCRLSIRDYMTSPQDDYGGNYTDLANEAADRAEAAAVRSEAAADRAEATAESFGDLETAVARAEEAADRAVTEATEAIAGASAEAAQVATAKADEVIAQRVAELGVVQSTGSSPTAVMSQKAVTKEVNAIKDVVGLPYPFAEGIANARTPAYDWITIVDGITIEKGKKYFIKAKIETSQTSYGVYVGLATSDKVWVVNNVVYITDTSENGEGSVVITAPDNMTDLRLAFLTSHTSNLSVYACLSDKELKSVSTVNKEDILQSTGNSPTAVMSQKAVTDMFGDTLMYMNFNAKDFIHGDALFWSDGDDYSAITYRIMCLRDKFYQFPQDVIVKASDGYRFAVGYYTDGVKTSDEGWNTEKKIPANQQFRIMLAKVNENTSEALDINETTKNFIIFAYAFAYVFNTENASKNVVNVSPAKPIEVLSINHRGYNTISPENTLPAYKLSKKKGFDFVEADIRFTSDNVPVLLHDPTINRTARNADGSTITSTININDITYQQALTYDFGIWKGSEYAGTKIPTLEEFLRLCRALSLHPYLDVYECTANNAEVIKNIIYSCGMERNITLISSDYNVLNFLADEMPNLRYGFVTWQENTSTAVAEVASLKSRGVNNIFIDIDTTLCDIGAYKTACQENGVELEVYSPNTESAILALDPFVSGVTSDTLVAKNVLLDGNLD